MFFIQYLIVLSFVCFCICSTEKSTETSKGFFGGSYNSNQMNNNRASTGSMFGIGGVNNMNSLGGMNMSNLNLGNNGGGISSLLNGNANMGGMGVGFNSNSLGGGPGGMGNLGGLGGGLGGLGGMGGPMAGAGGLGGVGGFGGMGGMGMKGITTPINISNKNNELLVSNGKILQDPIYLTEDMQGLELSISGQYMFTSSPQLLYPSNQMYVKVTGDFTLNTLYNNTTPQIMKLRFSCYDNSKSDVTLSLGINNEKLDLKINKACYYGYLDKVVNFLNIVYNVLVILLVVFIVACVYMIAKEGNLNLVKDCLGSTAKATFSFLGSKGTEKDIDNNFSFVEDEENNQCEEQSKQSRFRRLQMETETVNPKFYENPGLITSKKVKFDYENYGGCE